MKEEIMLDIMVAHGGNVSITRTNPSDMWSCKVVFKNDDVYYSYNNHLILAIHRAFNQWYWANFPEPTREALEIAEAIKI